MHLPRLALAPNWWPMSRQAQHHYLDALIDSPFERIYLGESVCSQRARLALPSLLEHANTLSEAGKEIILTSLSLVANQKDRALLSKLAQQHQFAIEANEIGAVAAAYQAGLPFVAGAGLNIYNLDSLRWLLQLGMHTYQPPLEMAQPALETLIAQTEHSGERQQFQLELLGYGYPPLAVSSRCISARVAGRNKQRCQQVCQHQGVKLATSLEGQPMMWLNGVQIHPDRPIDLLDSLSALRAVKLDWLRIDPGPKLDWHWVWALKQALLDGAETFDPPQIGTRQFWQRQHTTVALSND